MVENLHKIKKIRINGVWVDVRWIKKPKMGSTPVFGYFWSVNMEIVVDKNLPTCRRKMVLAHEMTHAACFILGHSANLDIINKAAGLKTPSGKRVYLNPEETLANTVELALTDFFIFSRDNPNIQWRK